MEQRLIDALPLIKELEKAINMVEKLDAPSSKGVLRECFSLIINAPTVEPVQSRKLTLDELKQISEEPLMHWIWIVSDDYDTAPYQIHRDYTEGTGFCCGYQGISYVFRYKEFDKTWTAYTSPPLSEEGE